MVDNPESASGNIDRNEVGHFGITKNLELVGFFKPSRLRRCENRRDRRRNHSTRTGKIVGFKVGPSFPQFKTVFFDVLLNCHIVLSFGENR